MAQGKKLSLWSAIFINLNVMIGTGIFINTYDLSICTGAAGFVLYPGIGLCMLPLIAVTADLLRYYPTGGLYAFAQNYSPYLGFLSCWSYFFGKLASACVMLTVATSMLQQIIPLLQTICPIRISLGILLLFTILNLQNMKLGVMIQSFFLTSKLIPLCLVVLAGILFFDSSALNNNLFLWDGIAHNIPLILYCLAGFETTCSLSRTIENPSVNGPKAVYYSFGIIMLLYGIFQFFIYMNIYQTIDQINSYKTIFSIIAQRLSSSPAMANIVGLIMSCAICASALGGAYGILFSNAWNMYTLAEHKHTFAAAALTKLNKHQVPSMAIYAEMVICTLFLLLNRTSLLSLRYTAALGIAIAYTISTICYYVLIKNHDNANRNKILAAAALCTCMIFITSCMLNFFQQGISPLILFATILVIGSSMFLYTKQ